MKGTIMKCHYAAAALAGILLTLTGCSDAPDNRAADAKAIRDIETQWKSEYAAKELDKVGAHYADDAVLMTQGSPAASTAEARKELLKGMLADPAFALSFEATSVEVAKSGELAASRGTYTMTMTDPVTKKPVNDHGNYVTVYRKQTGTWKAVSDINVSDVPAHPAATAKKAPAKKAAAKKKKK